jgi:hypothetical protein
MRGQPLARGSLCLSDLIRRHFARKLDAVLKRFPAAAKRREIEPFMRHDKIGYDIFARRVEHAQLEERVWSAGLRRCFHPCRHFHPCHLKSPA